MTVSLRPMRGDEFERWLPALREGYAVAMTEQGGMPEDAARRKAAADVGRLFPGDRPAADQSVYVVEADGERVGELWLAERRPDTDEHALWIFDIRIDEAQRGRGHGRAAMRLAEDEARRRGLDRIILNVFGRNDVARRLYRSLGYEEAAVTMRKLV
jgi:ribosomal protein S18 acetylase RimI-like enzyme